MPKQQDRRSIFHERDLVFDAKINNSVPGKHAFNADQHIFREREDDVEKRLEIGLKILMPSGFALLVDDVHVHFSCMQIFLVFNNWTRLDGFWFRWWCSWCNSRPFYEEMEGNIIFDITEENPDEFFKNHESDLQVYQKNGLRLNCSNPEHFINSLTLNGVSVYCNDPSYGLSGWIIAKEMKITEK